MCRRSLFRRTICRQSNGQFRLLKRIIQFIVLLPFNNYGYFLGSLRSNLYQGHGQWVLTFWSWDQQVNLVPLGVWPALDDCGSQLNVSLVHFWRLPHVDLQVLPDQRKQGRGEVDLFMGNMQKWFVSSGSTRLYFCAPQWPTITFWVVGFIWIFFRFPKI